MGSAVISAWHEAFRLSSSSTAGQGVLSGRGHYPKEFLYNPRRVLPAPLGREELDFYTKPFESSRPFVIIRSGGGGVIWISLNLEDAPLARGGFDQEIRFPLAPFVARHGQGKVQHGSPVQSFRYRNLRRRPEEQPVILERGCGHEVALVPGLIPA